MTEITEVAAWVSLAAVAISGGVLLILHVVKAELDPSWRMVSEYAIGRSGWLMVVVLHRDLHRALAAHA